MITKILPILIFLLSLSWTGMCADSLSYERDVRPLLEKKCIKCHNTGSPKGGVNIDNFKEQGRVIANGVFWLKVLGVIKDGSMPPKTEVALSHQDYEALVNNLDAILQSSLKDRTPGKVVIRRLSHAEYKYTIADLVGIDFEPKSFFPSDGSGGGGFDNQGKSLFVSPLKLERYYDASDQIVSGLLAEEEKWQKVVPFQFGVGGWEGFVMWFKALFSDKYDYYKNPQLASQKVIDQFASRAYRRFLKAEERAKLLALFDQVYESTAKEPNPGRFNNSIAQVLKAILVSPNFLYKVEEEPQKEGAYPLSDFEVATRLSYFLWSSTPDQELFDLAYDGKLHDSTVLASQVTRMLDDPKAKRFSESFAGQWLGISKLLDDESMVDEATFPEFDKDLRKDLHQEAVSYFHYVLTKSRNFLDLVQSDYSIINKRVADFYGIENVNHDDFRKVQFANNQRGGVLGMGSVLASTSISFRTSPVLRGKWVMEQILGISPPPPPAEVSALTEDKNTHEALGLRKILEMHRSDPACQSCHEKMDPLGLGLENYDASGKWRETYGKVAIDASGVTSDGEKFNGPDELKNILLKQKERIARNISTKMLSYALGRSIMFTDEPAVRDLEQALLRSNFDTHSFIIQLVNSYPFLLKINDFEKKSV
ncbi:Protein of unknown function [Spirosomataceae bacterium TFI 002]|nr:Protein of unknown function [Spirosomataceae bacterium TFI 002]